MGRFYELKPEGDTPSFILPRVKQRGRRQNSLPPFFDLGRAREGVQRTIGSENKH
jgi:hypothetical protein